MCKTPRMRSGSTERNKELIEGRRGLGVQGWDLGLGLGRKCAWQGWKERPFRGGGGSGVGAALEQKPGRELSGAKRRRDLDFTALTSASNRMSTFHTRGQIHNLEVTSTPNVTWWKMFHKVIWFVRVKFDDFSECRRGSERNMLRYGNCWVFFTSWLYCNTSGFNQNELVASEFAVIIWSRFTLKKGDKTARTEASLRNNQDRHSLSCKPTQTHLDS